MSTKFGMYVFFLENPSNQQGQCRAGCVRLGPNGPGDIVRFDTESLPGLGNGIAACMFDNDSFLVFVTDAQKNIWEVRFDGQSVMGVARITTPGVSTGEDMGVVNKTGAPQLFFVKDRQGYVTQRQVNGTWSDPQNLGLQTVNDGISAHLHEGSIALAYQTSGNQILVQKGWGSDAEGINPPKGYLAYSTPRLCTNQQSLFLAWRSADNNQKLFSSQRIHGQWSGQGSAPECIMYNSPAVCSFGYDVFCFTQGNNNKMYYQIFACGSWVDGLNTLTGRGGEGLGNIWFSPYALRT